MVIQRERESVGNRRHDTVCLLDLSKRIIRFTSNGDGIGTYDIFQYQIINSTDKLDYVTVGEFSDTGQNQER